MRGSVLHEQAYAQGKMLDHSRWNEILPRNITPSDIDMVLDDGRHGRVLMCELSSRVDCWQDVGIGQRKLYQALVASGCGRVFAVLLKHSTPSHQQIDTRFGIESFQMMRFAALIGTSTGKIFAGDKWSDFVSDFYAGVSI